MNMISNTACIDDFEPGTEIRTMVFSRFFGAMKKGPAKDNAQSFFTLQTTAKAALIGGVKQAYDAPMPQTGANGWAYQPNERALAREGLVALHVGPQQGSARNLTLR